MMISSRTPTFFPASLQMEKTWVQKLEEARKERHREVAEITCQTDETEPSSLTLSAEELDSRLSAQKQQLQLEANKARRKAVEEARKQVQRELQEKHLEDMAKQVSGFNDPQNSRQMSFTELNKGILDPCRQTTVFRCCFVPLTLSCLHNYSF